MHLTNIRNSYNEFQYNCINNINQSTYLSLLTCSSCKQILHLLVDALTYIVHSTRTVLGVGVAGGWSKSLEFTAQFLHNRSLLKLICFNLFTHHNLILVSTSSLDLDQACHFTFLIPLINLTKKSSMIVHINNFLQQFMGVDG